MAFLAPHLTDNWSDVGSFMDPLSLRCLAATCRDARRAVGTRVSKAKDVVAILHTEPHAGLAAAVQQGIIHDTVDAQAQLLHSLHTVVRPKAIGVAICPLRLQDSKMEDDWHRAKPLADAYMQAFDFDGVPVVDALRTVLLKTSVPNSSLAVSFLLKAIARRFLATNSGPSSCFTTVDSVYLTMYAAFILNGDLRNPVIKRAHKMTKERFIAINSTVPLMAGVTPDMFSQVFDDVQSHPLPTLGWKTPAVDLRRAATLRDKFSSALCTVSRTLQALW